MTKAGPSRLRAQLVQSADTARKLDPQLAAAPASCPDDPARRHPPQGSLRRGRPPGRARLADHVPRQPYVICDSTANPSPLEQARHLIVEHLTVPAETRHRRRATKPTSTMAKAGAGAGIAPHQAHTGGMPGHSVRLDTRVPPPQPDHAHHHGQPDPALDTQAALGNQPSRRPPAQSGPAHHHRGPPP